MSKFVRLAFAAILAVVAMGAASSVASATGTVSISTGTTTATTGALTLRDSALANVIGAITLTVTIRTGTIACDLTNGVVIGGVTASNIVISSPRGYTATGAGFPWAVSSRCFLHADGRIGVTIRPNFSINAGLLGVYSYTGTVNGLLAVNGSVITGLDSILTSNRGSTASFITPWQFNLNPAISWRLI